MRCSLVAAGSPASSFSRIRQLPVSSSISWSCPSAAKLPIRFAEQRRFGLTDLEPYRTPDRERDA
jgi:hypothetical protein